MADDDEGVEVPPPSDEVQAAVEAALAVGVPLESIAHSMQAAVIAARTWGRTERIDVGRDLTPEQREAFAALLQAMRRQDRG